MVATTKERRMPAGESGDGDSSDGGSGDGDSSDGGSGGGDSGGGVGRNEGEYDILEVHRLDRRRSLAETPTRSRPGAARDIRVKDLS